MAGFWRVALPAAGVESPGSSEASSGYLQDAVAHWSGRCRNKRQRMVATTPSPPPRPATVVSEDLHCLVEVRLLVPGYRCSVDVEL